MYLPASNTMDKKVLILFTSVGLGHKTIAENIGWHLEQDGMQVKLFDILEVQSGSLVNFGTGLHSFINRKLPFVWRWLYMSKLMTFLTVPFRVKLASKNTGRTKQIIDEFNPDLVITTQTTASAVMAALKDSGDYKNKLAIAFSDYHFHPFWLYKQADAYLVNIVEQKQEMIKRGVSEEKIFVCGMTLKPKPEIDAASVKQRLGIAANDKVVLLASGSLGIGSSADGLLSLIDQIESKVNSNNPTSYIVVCGKNEVMLKELQTKSKNPKTKLFGFYTPLSELYAISNLFVTKPGGLSTAESLQMHLPLFVTHILAGQEELNYEYLKQRKLIEPAMDLSIPELADKIVKELETHAIRDSLSQNSSLTELIGQNRKPNAVVEAVKTLFHEV